MSGVITVWIRFLSAYCPVLSFSTPSLAMNVSPQKSCQPSMRRAACADSPISSGRIPRALSRMARRVARVMLPAVDSPRSFSLPPETIKNCQIFRLAYGPSETTNSQSSISASDDCDCLNQPPSPAPPGRMLMVNGTMVPAGIGSKPEDCLSAPLKS